MWKWSRCFLLVMVGTLVLPGRSTAEQIRYRFVPIDPAGNMRQVAIGPDGAIGERITGIGLIPKPYFETFRPTHMAKFVHPYNARLVVVPITLPQGELPPPVMRADRAIYHYGTYRIEVLFLPDGAVETIYNGGFLRLAKAP